ncbi:hypothetical protein RRG08_053224 [Elysia crispata]|uniref:Uncharacterized protein n=1 Tax=Elysia crispata TaxID=231223 RepID=A0AAE1ANL8_9GAST|nr:hypothetical protein RRG08_053224 [Elysia crispata]
MLFSLFRATVYITRHYLDPPTFLGRASARLAGADVYKWINYGRLQDQPTQSDVNQANVAQLCFGAGNDPRSIIAPLVKQADQCRHVNRNSIFEAKLELTQPLLDRMSPGDTTPWRSWRTFLSTLTATLLLCASGCHGNDQSANHLLLFDTLPDGISSHKAAPFDVRTNFSGAILSQCLSAIRPPAHARERENPRDEEELTLQPLCLPGADMTRDLESLPGLSQVEIWKSF